MYQEFIQFIRQKGLFTTGQRLLLGVSGGPDSVVLLHLIARTGNPFAIAHCNFNLRGADSDADEHFVQRLADDYGVACFLSSFPTREYAAGKGISIEMAARELRYEWFEKIRRENGFNCIAVGHHLDDVLETFMLNLSRGTGIRGLSGIRPKAGSLIRPLLFASRGDIDRYIVQQGLSFRVDESNSDVRLKRNKIRHQILPLMEELNPSFRVNLEKTIGYLDQVRELLTLEMEKVRDELVQTEAEWFRIPYDALRKLQPLSLYLFELLRPWHFSPEMIADIEQAMDNEPGRIFYAPGYRLVCDRAAFLITPLGQVEERPVYIEKCPDEIWAPFHLRLTTEPYGNAYPIPVSPNCAVVDFEKIDFPLALRRWKQGEYFQPFGMKGLKKVSDFFIDEKYSLPEKEKAWIVSSGDRIVWIVGKRIDDRFRLTPKTRTVLKMEIIDE